jgi:electron transfer flavoprotein beta subunit
VTVGARSNAIVCVTPVIDTSRPLDPAALSVVPSSDGRATNGTPSPLLNPADEAAVRAAAELGGRDAVMVVHVGDVGGESALRDALAAGAGRAVRLQPSEGPIDAVIVAEALGAFITCAPPQWVLCGQATLDWAGGLVPAMIAEILGWPLIDRILAIDRESDDVVRAVRTMNHGVRENVRIKSQAVLAMSPLAFQPSIPPLRDRLRAQRAAVEVRQATVAGCLPRPTGWQVTAPRPRPKAALPPDYSDWTPEDRLRFLTESPKSTQAKTRMVDGDPTEIASEILAFIGECGVHVKGMPRSTAR